MRSPFGYVADTDRMGALDFSKVDVSSIGKGYKVVDKIPSADNPTWSRKRAVNPVLRSAATDRRLKATQELGSVVDTPVIMDAVSKALALTEEIDFRAKAKFRSTLASHISEIRTMLVQEIAPTMLAFPTAHEAAQEDMREITKDERLTLDTMGIEKQMMRAARIKLVMKVASLMKVHPSLLLSEFSKDITLQELKSLLDSMGD